MNKLIILFLTFSVSSLLYSQDISQSKLSFLENYKAIEISNSISNHENFFDLHGNKMGLDKEDDFKLIHSEEGRNGYSHYKYQQYHQGIEIYAGTYILHEKDGHVISS